MAFLNTVGVQFAEAGKIYYFRFEGHDLKIGDRVVVETERGLGLVRVVCIQYQENTKKLDFIKNILRVANKRDLSRETTISQEEILHFVRKKVQNLNLDMQILRIDVQFGGDKIVVYFSAPGRVDFRELIKDLSHALKARLELKQLGHRDATKLLGGIGTCGREYCCSTFLREFIPVSIKMVKHQNLALNPKKISGGCGRLLCCLSYEDDFYRTLRKKMPLLNSKVCIKDSGVKGVVSRIDFFNQLVFLDVDGGRTISCSVDQVFPVKGDISNANNV